MSSICFSVTDKGVVQAAPPEDTKKDRHGNGAPGKADKKNGSGNCITGTPVEVGALSW